MPCVSLPLGGEVSSIGVGGAGVASVVVPVVSLGAAGAVVGVVVVVPAGASTGVLDGSCACVLGSWVELVVTSVTGGVAGLGATGTVVVPLSGGVPAARRVETGGVFGASGLVFFAR